MGNREKTIFKLHKKFGKALKDYNLIQDNDKILVGLSGGKDSLALIEFLSKRMSIYKPKFTVVAAHITVDNIPYKSDIEYLKQYCESYGVEFKHFTTSFDASTDTRKTPCFLCSWNRRKALFNAAKELECTKIALGHHQDDILETLLMNLSFQGAFSTMPPYLKMNKLDVDIIRPMCLITEDEIKELEAIREYKKQIKNCPYEQASNRPKIKEILKQMKELNPNAYSSLWGAMNNIQTEYLPQKQ